MDVNYLHRRSKNLKSHFKLAPISCPGYPKKSLIRSAWTLFALLWSTFQTWVLTDLCWEGESKAFVYFVLVLGPGWNNYFHCFWNISMLFLLHPRKENQKKRHEKEINHLKSYKYSKKIEDFSFLIEKLMRGRALLKMQVEISINSLCRSYMLLLCSEKMG